MGVKTTMQLKFNPAAIEKLGLEEPSIPKKYTILIVDDEPTNISSLVRLLERHYEILTAKDGQEALTLLQTEIHPERIQLIISDQRMPKMTGVEFFAQTIAMIPQTIRILLTGFTDITSLIDSINQGQIYKFLTKPIEPNDLVLTVQRALETYELAKKNEKLIEQLQEFNASLEEKVKIRTAELEQAYNQIKTQQDHINRELKEAQETQRALLPTTLPIIPKARMFCCYEPMGKVGGDFYQVLRLDEQNYGILIADVTGHGPSAAMISFMVAGMFSEALKSGLSPRSVLSLTNSLLQHKLQEGKFASMFYAVYNSASQILTYANASNPSPLLIRGTSHQILPLTAEGMLLGLFPNELLPYEEKQIQLLPQDKLLLYSDALTEIYNKDDQMFGETRFLTLLHNHYETPLQELLKILYQEGLRYGGKSYYDDDFTLVGLEITAP